MPEDTYVDSCAHEGVTVPEPKEIAVSCKFMICCDETRAETLGNQQIIFTKQSLNYERECEKTEMSHSIVPSLLLRNYNYYYRAINFRNTIIFSEEFENFKIIFFFDLFAEKNHSKLIFFI
mgnify:FL=1